MRRPIRLGMVRLTDAAPIVVALERGLFAAEGLDVTIQVEPSWANVADRLAWGLLDGAVMLPPLAIAMALGLRGPVTPLVVPAGISLNGNAVTLSRRWADVVVAPGEVVGPGAVARRFRAALGGARPRLAVVHAFSTHDLLLRLFLEQGGIDPVRDVEITVLPPPAMPAALAAGEIDGFCAGAPWGGVADRDGVGRTVAVSSEIRRNHPEKCLAVNAAWAEAAPDAVIALVRAILRAGLICDDPVEAAGVAALLAGPLWLDLDVDLIAASLPGGVGGAVDQSVFAAHGAGVPRVEDARWFVGEMGRWRELPADAEARAAGVYRPDLHAAAVGSIDGGAGREEGGH